jgi:hypothetical protein
VKVHLDVVHVRLGLGLDRDLQHRLLGLREELVIGAVAVPQGHHLAQPLDPLPPLRLRPDDAGVVAQVLCRHDLGHEVGQVVGAAEGAQLVERVSRAHLLNHGQ